MSGISNFTIEKIINEDDDDLKANFAGVFPSNHTFKFVNFRNLVKQKHPPYPFLIMNTGRAGKQGTHWWSFLEISSKEQIFLFDSYGFVGLKEFVIDNDRKLIDKFFHGLNKMNKKDSEINLKHVEFIPPAYGKIDISQLTTTAQDFFHTLNEFSKVHKSKKLMFIWLTIVCMIWNWTLVGHFSYIFTNLFLPNYKSKILNSKKLIMRTISTLLNELFTLDISENERRVENFAEQLNIKME